MSKSSKTRASSSGRKVERFFSRLSSKIGRAISALARIRRRVFIFAAILLMIQTICWIYAAFLEDNVVRTRNSALISWLGGIAGVMFSISLVAMIYSVIMVLYLLIKRKNPAAKFKIEVAFGVFVILESWICKFVVIVIYGLNVHEAMVVLDPDTPPIHWLSFIAQATLDSFYSMIGGLQFEGLAFDFTTIGNVYLACAYYASSIIAGLVFVSIIASKAAYEFFSMILLRVYRYEYHPVYIFTALNKETLCIARSIVAEKEIEREEAEHNLGDDYLSDHKAYLKQLRRTYEPIIVFAGPALEPFDRHDENCVEAMANGFLYCSFSAQDGVTLPQKLGMGRLNRAPKDFVEYADQEPRPVIPDGASEEEIEAINEAFQKRKTEKLIQRVEERRVSEFVVFAFDADDDHIPNEEENMDFVFLDIVNRLAKPAKKCDFLPVRYYILTKRKINYQAYQEKVMALAKEPKTNRAYSEFKRDLYSVFVWNESDAIAEEAQRYLQSNVTNNVIPQAEETRVWSLGFGATGQSLARALFISSSNVRDDFTTSAFTCEVFDPDGPSGIAGLFQLELPLSVVLTGDYSAADLEATYLAQKKTLDRRYFGKDPDEVLTYCLDKEFRYPCFLFHDEAGTDYRFLQRLNAEIDRSGDPALLHGLPHYIVIASGEDFVNIRQANALVERLSRVDLPHPVTIFVNVWDEKNNNLIDGYELSGMRSQREGFTQAIRHNPLLHVVVIGNNSDIYSYFQIRSLNEVINYDRIYGRVYSKNTKNLEYPKFEIPASAYFRGEPAETIPYPASGESDVIGAVELWANIDKEERVLSLRRWDQLDLWSRYSTRCAYLNGKTYAAMERLYRESASDVGIFYAKLTLIEHIRWTRTHIADGWIYQPKTDKLFRLHNCIYPAGLIASEKLRNDLANVFLGIASARPEVLQATTTDKPV